MKLSRTSYYAIKAMVHVARKAPHLGEAQAIGHAIATDCGMPEGFLLRILVMLSRADLLRSIKGPHGGYRLAKHPSDISLLAVVEATEGKLHGDVAEVAGVIDPEGIEGKLKVICGTLCETQREFLAGISLDDLLGDKAKRVARRKAAV